MRSSLAQWKIRLRFVPRLCPETYAQGMVSCAPYHSPMSQTPSFEITFHLRVGNSGQQKAVVQATSLDAARRIFIQQNPGCVLDSARELPRR